MRKMADYLNYLKSPYTIIGSVVTAGLVVNIYLAFVFVLPPYLNERQFNNQIDALQQQKAAIENKPIPAKVTDEDIQKLVEQVPTQEELVRFLFSIRELEASSGAIIETVSMGNVSSNDPLTALGLTSGNEEAPSTQQQNRSKSSTANGSSSSQKQAKNDQTTVAHDLTIAINGSYPSTVDFINGLYQMNRFVNVRKWTVTAGNTNPASSGMIASKAADETRENTRMVIEITIFSANAYEGKFKELPPLSPHIVDKRLDPTWTEEHFQALLRTTQPQQ
ncbi:MULTISPECIES: hypothetical protein [Paenibacillus]|uniref:Uncharacterized protein n=1 Tax=Paenibacillus validus TaxID=44253 RepID=A0A7X3CS35_9BACL|nr:MULTISPECIES: hypothetical protein [Paenibacillus]MUG69597.1 hypothetical protein [Paenibacillus validus]